MIPAVTFVSLGCPKNLVDTEVMAGVVLTSSCDLTFDPEEAGVMVVNTCGFIPSAREEADRAIRDALKWKKRRAGRKVVIAGCLLQWDRDRTFLERYPGVDLWNGVDGAPHLGEYLRQLPQAEVKNLSPTPCYLYDERTPRLLLTAPHLAYLKIADGCDNCCSYCSIPNIRGRLRSRPIASVIAEARNLIAGGVRELLVIAQDVTAYGMDRPESGDDLARLLAALEELPGDFRIRLLYTHPAHYSDALIAQLARSRKLWPYLDMPLQHIDDDILQRMGRKVSRRETAELIARLRQAIPGLTLRTTFITGLPGEGEAEFAGLEAFIREQRFERLGVFAYSPEPGTPAAAFPDQVPQAVAEERADRLMEIQRGISAEHNRRLIGRTLEVMIDDWRRDRGVGRGPGDAPEIDNAVRLRGKGRHQPGDIVAATITGADDFDLTAIIEKDGKR